MPIPAAPAPSKDDPRVGQGRAGCAQPGQHAGDDDRGGALDVVVEGRHAVAVAVEDAQRVGLLEVLPLDDAAGPDLGHARHERLDQRVVGRTAHAGYPVAEIERIRQQRRVVGPDVQGDRQGQGRVDPAARRVQRQLPDRDGHPPGALVAQTEDPLVVGHHDEPDVLVRALPQEVGDAVDVGGRDPGPARPPDDVAELLAGAPDSRRVDDRQELVKVLGQEPIEDRRVAILECCQADVSLERVILAAQVLELELTCSSIVRIRSGSRPRRWNASRSSSVKARSLVSSRLPSSAGSGQPDRGRTAGGDGVEGLGQRSQPAEDTGRSATGDDKRADHAVRLVARAGGRCTGRSPASSNRTVVARRRPGRDGDLGRARAVDRLGAGPVALVDRGIADDPLVVDRVVVAEHDRDGRPAGTLRRVGP